MRVRRRLRLRAMVRVRVRVRVRVLSWSFKVRVRWPQLTAGGEELEARTARVVEQGGLAPAQHLVRGRVRGRGRS